MLSPELKQLEADLTALAAENGLDVSVVFNDSATLNVKLCFSGVTDEEVQRIGDLQGRISEIDGGQIHIGTWAEFRRFNLTCYVDKRDLDRFAGKIRRHREEGNGSLEKQPAATPGAEA